MVNYEYGEKITSKVCMGHGCRAAVFFFFFFFWQRLWPVEVPGLGIEPMP